MNLAVKNQPGKVVPLKKELITDWESLPLLLNAEWILKILPKGTLGRDHVYGLWEMPGFPGLRIGRKKVVGRDALRRWLEMQEV